MVADTGILSRLLLLMHAASLGCPILAHVTLTCFALSLDTARLINHVHYCARNTVLTATVQSCC